ncbi:MAG: hypothetical protein HN704_15430 [Bacteroidetes bacterium]|nr:hypothetical protein [Bacteroidota bacterium]MBT6684912.1 hypothetical protein [Bacteroidota bacterium]MBT7145217.1 hypothetical protein [Bacteroidota bacterium]MBT7492989.1 hypothetical protein [Bacteroidota bacterium]
MNFKKSIKIWFKVVLLLLVFLIVNYTMYLFIVPFYWGNTRFQPKYEYIKSNSETHNMLFFGASNIARGFVPEVFDELCQSAGITMNSYNFGVDLLVPPEEFFLYEKMLDEGLPGVEYVFLCLSPIIQIDEKYMHTTRIKYWYSPGYLWFTLKSIYNSSLSEAEKDNALNNHLISFAEKLFSIDFVKDIIRYYSKEYDSSLAENDGYQSYDKLAKGKNRFSTIRRKFLKNSDQMFVNRKTNKRFFETFELDTEYNPVFLEKINQLIKKSDKQGIQLIFVLPPRLQNEEYLELFPLFMQIENDNRIELARAEKYPSLYYISNSFDFIHLNDAGAREFSKLLAQKFYRIKSGRRSYSD